MSASRGILPAIAASMANSRAARNHEQKSIRLDIKKLEALCAVGSANRWGAWSPEGDYFPEGNRLLICKPEVHTALWSAA